MLRLLLLIHTSPPSDHSPVPFHRSLFSSPSFFFLILSIPHVPTSSASPPPTIAHILLFSPSASEPTLPALALLNASFLLRDILLHWPLRWLAGCHLHSMDSSIHLSSWTALILLSHAALRHPVHLSSLMSSFQILTCLHFRSAKLLIILHREGRVQVGDYCQVLARFDGNAGRDTRRSSSLGWEHLFPASVF